MNAPTPAAAKAASPAALAQLSKKDRVGFVGLGVMGGPIARHLLIAGQRVVGHDAGEVECTRFSESGGALARTVEEMVRSCTVVLTCLPDSEALVDMVEMRMVPHAQKGQTIIDLSAVVPRHARRMAKAFARKGAALLDAPVSGSPAEAERGALRVFCGGELDAFERHKPLLSVVASAGRVYYCGSSGMGQVVRGVNMLATGLVNAALLEAAALGVGAGVRPEHLREALGGADGWRMQFDEVCQAIERGQAESIPVGSTQYDMLIDEAADKKLPLPITLSMRHFLREAEKVLTELDRPAPSYWRELTTNAAVHLRPAPPAKLPQQPQ